MGSKFCEEMCIGPRHAAMHDISHDRDLESVQAAFALSNGQGIEQRLCGMLMGSIPAVDDASPGHARDGLRRAGRTVSYDNAVRGHGIQGPCRVDESFSFGDAAR